MVIEWRADLLALACFASLGCGNEDGVDPLDCEVAEHLIPLSAQVTPAGQLSFRDDWGQAPERMKLRVVRGGATRFDLAGCGRDADATLWELSASWFQLPEQDPSSASIELFDRARLDDGETLGDEPHFAGSLLRCWKGGCVEVDRYAFHYRYSASMPDYVSGRADIELLDREGGRFVATIVAEPQTPNPGPPSRIELDITWDPQSLPAPPGG
jgi:hypothetical protein